MWIKPNSNRVHDVFVARLTEAQFGLLNYIVLLLGDYDAARDVLQETNLDLWRKADSYDESRPFMPWARTMARYQVLTYRKKKSRDRLLFDNDMIETVASDPPDDNGQDFSRLAGALRECMQKLNDSQRSIINARYFECKPLAAIAQAKGCSVPAVGMSLLRVRGILARCIRGKVGGQPR